MSLVPVRLGAGRTVPHLTSHLHSESRGRWGTHWQEIQPHLLNGQEEESKQGTTWPKDRSPPRCGVLPPRPSGLGTFPQSSSASPTTSSEFGPDLTGMGKDAQQTQARDFPGWELAPSLVFQKRAAGFWIGSIFRVVSCGGSDQI